MAYSNSASPSMKLLVAVDFGTTFSGVAFLQTMNHTKDTVIQDWGEGATAEKVPTVLKYNGFGPPEWGFQVDEDDKDKIEWFKLGLYPHFKETALARRYPINRPEMSDHDCKRHVVDYLTALREHVDTYLKVHLTAAFWRSTPIEYIITVPAVWPDKSKNTTLACAIQAGMARTGDIQIVAEPEAAGIYALERMQNIDLKVNDTFVVCDAGGGTVDLISYTVKSLRGIPTIEEAAVGSGALCGGSFLNRIFAEYLTTKFTGYNDWDENYQAAAMKRFEDTIKRKFSGDVNKVYSIPVRGLPDDWNLGIKSGVLSIPGRDIKRVFEPVIKEIVKLVKAQIGATRKNVKMVLLAGGFGRNVYLCNRLQEEVGTEIGVRPCLESNTAIVRGALIHGLAQKAPNLATALVNARLARKHYGTKCWLPLTERYDARRSRTDKEELTGQVLIEVMKWYLQKGHPAQESKPKYFDFYVDQPVDEGALQPADIDVYICEDPTNMGPPDYPRAEAPLFMKLKADFSRIPQQTLHREIDNNGRVFYKIYFQVEMTLESASLKFALNYKGQSYETVQMVFV